MEEITRLAKLSVLRASGFSGIAILMVMMGTAHDPSLSFRFGALGLLILSAAMGLYATAYAYRRRVDETEVWIMMLPERRPEKTIALRLIVTAMRAQLIEKAQWWAWLALAFLGISVLIPLMLDRSG